MRNLLLLILVSASINTFGQIKVSALKAPAHIGDSVAMLEKVYSTRVFPNGMTLLNLGARYPRELLVLFIPPQIKTKFNYKPEIYLKDKKVLVTGRLIKNIGKPQIVIYDPKQISILSADAEESWKTLKDGQWVQEPHKLEEQAKL